AVNGWIVSGYFAGSISTSASAAGVTQPAQILTRGNTAASSTSVRAPARASCHAAVLPPGPPPTTMTSGATARALAPQQRRRPNGEEQPQPLGQRQVDLLQRVGDVHGGEQVALDVDGAADERLAERQRGGIAHQPQERVGRVNDDREGRRARAERDHGAVPEPERERGRNGREDLAENARRPLGKVGSRESRAQGVRLLAGFIMGATLPLSIDLGKLARVELEPHRLVNLEDFVGAGGDAEV